MNNEDKPIGITDAHPILKEGCFWFLIGAIIVAGSIIAYTLVVIYPLTMQQEEQVKYMDCGAV